MRYSLFCSEESFVDEIDLIEKISALGMEHLYVRKPNGLWGVFCSPFPNRFARKLFCTAFRVPLRNLGLPEFYSHWNGFCKMKKRYGTPSFHLGFCFTP